MFAPMGGSATPLVDYLAVLGRGALIAAVIVGTFAIVRHSKGKRAP